MPRHAQAPSSHRPVICFVLSLIINVLLAAPARAANYDTPGLGGTFHSRLFVILDTSTSMRLSVTTNVGGGLLLGHEDDWYPPNGSGACTSRFCIAKRQLYNTLSSNTSGGTYADKARVGLSGYYQYLLTTSPSGNLFTQCEYDVLANPGEYTWQVSNLTDGTLEGTTRFPDNGTINTNCQNNAAEQYTMGTKTTVSSVTHTCSMFGANSDGTQISPVNTGSTATGVAVSNCTGSTCDPNVTGMTATGSAMQDPAAPNHIYKWMSTSTTSCGTGYYTWTGSLNKFNTPPAPTTVTNSSTFSATSVGGWYHTGETTATFKKDCGASGTEPGCTMFLASTTPVTYASTMPAWFGFFSDSENVSATLKGSKTAYQLKNATNYSAPPATTPNAGVTYTWQTASTADASLAAACGSYSGRLTSGSLGAVGGGHSNFKYSTAIALDGDMTGFTDYTVTDGITASAGACNANWPCSILTSTTHSCTSDADCATGVGFRCCTAADTPSLGCPVGYCYYNNNTTDIRYCSHANATYSYGYTDTNSGQYYRIFKCNDGSCATDTCSNIQGQANGTSFNPGYQGPAATLCGQQTNFCPSNKCDFENVPADGSKPYAYSTGCDTPKTTYTADNPYSATSNSCVASGCNGPSGTTSDAASNPSCLVPVIATGPVSAGNEVVILEQGNTCPAAGTNWTNPGPGNGIVSTSGVCSNGKTCTLGALTQGWDNTHTQSTTVYNGSVTPTGYGAGTQATSQASAYASLTTTPDYQASSDATACHDTQNVFASGNTYVTSSSTLCSGLAAPCSVRFDGISRVSCTSDADCTAAKVNQSSNFYCDAGTNTCSRDGYYPEVCKYTQMKYVWTRPDTMCTYPLQKWTWAGSGKIYWCRYDLPVYSYSVVTPHYQYQCDLTSRVRRYEFATIPTQKACEYFRIARQYSYTSGSYNYAYNSKGGEVVGHFYYRDPTDNYCNSTGNACTGSNGPYSCNVYNAGFGPSQVCPERLTGSVVPATSTFGSPVDCTTHRCLLRWRTTDNGITNGRNLNAKSATADDTYCIAPDYTSAAPTQSGLLSASDGSSLTLSCDAGQYITSIDFAYYGDAAQNGNCSQSTIASIGQANVVSAFAAPSAQCINHTSCTVAVNSTTMGGDPAAGNPKCAAVRFSCGTSSQNPSNPNNYVCDFASGTGTKGYSLIADYYDPTATNTLPANTPTTNYAWNNQPTKESGWSAKLSTTSPDLLNPIPMPGGTPLSGIFVQVPPDGTSNSVALQQATSACVMPNASNVDPTGTQYSPAGLCTPSDNTGVPDYTPLYGTLKNAGDYMSRLLATDAQGGDCRKYAMLLITDGAEFTPKNYTDLANLVATNWNAGLTGYRTATNPGGIYTSVVGFGSSLTADQRAVLDSMAIAGNSFYGKAYDAQDQDGLATAISDFFVHATAGYYTRSRPAISTDGKRIYSAFFGKSSVSPEFIGYMKAYAINDLDGSLAEKWDFGAKINDDAAQPPGARNLWTENDGTPGVFGTSNSIGLLGALVSQSSDPFWPTAAQYPPSGLDATAIVNFATNPYRSAQFSTSAGSTRTSRLGAITHSNPIPVFASTNSSIYGGSTDTQQSAYLGFQTATQARPMRVYVGTSDGLKAVVEGDPSCPSGSDESTSACKNGTEAFAFVPGEMQPNLWREIKGDHQYGVDGPLMAADVCGSVTGTFPNLNATGADSCGAGDWKTYLYAGMREGGKSVFALDITNGAFDFAWKYSDSRLYNTWSTPTAGRIKWGGSDRFMTYFGSGRHCVACSGSQAANTFILDALTGKPLAEGAAESIYPTDSMTTYQVQLTNAEMDARPVLYRPPASPYISTAVMAANGNPNPSNGIGEGVLLISRFGTSNTSVSSWAPVVFFDPGSNGFTKDPNGNAVTVNTIAFSGGTWTLQSAGSLPISGALPPIYLRPKAEAIWDPSGSLADYYVGTGNAYEPVDNPSGTNYFYAVHDNGDSTTPGQPLWVVKFPHTNEQVVGEPAIIPGAVIVPTYVPSTAGNCAAYGDAWLYAFEPKSGALVNALIPPSAGTSGSASAVPVIELPNAGLLSDLVAVGSTLYYNQENTSLTGGRPTGVTVSTAGSPGKVQSWRRLK